MAFSRLSPNILQKFKEGFQNDPKNILALNACVKSDPFEVCISRKVMEKTNHVYHHNVEVEGKPISNQKSTKCCWIYAAINVMRIPLMKHYSIEKFEFSHSYLYFWDKLEKCNFWLNNIVKTAQAKEPVDGRIVHFLLNDVVNDGGQWDMICNIINKYGLMPKDCFPETFSSESSTKMNSLLKSVLRHFAKDLRNMVEGDAPDQKIEDTILHQMSHIYRILAICLGVPPDTFTWEYFDKAKNPEIIGPVTPQEFYTNYVKPLYNVDDKVCLINDPRPCNFFNTAFTVEFLGNMVDGKKIIYNNQPIELLLQLATESIKNNEAVWFGCDVSKRLAHKSGVNDLEIQDLNLVFGLNPPMNLSKSERLIYGDSCMTHAMIFTGVSVDSDGVATKFKVENSWGEDRGRKGFYLMTTPWFKEFVYEVVVDKKFVSESVLNVFQQEPIVLPPWDPMGALAA